MKKIVITMAAVIWGMAGIADAAPDSNSIIRNGIEYYMQTDKAVYDLGEDVVMLYRVTNLGDEDVFFEFSTNKQYHFSVESGGELIWEMDRDAAMILTYFTLQPTEFIEFSETWNQVDNDGIPVEPGNYQVIGELGYPFQSNQYVPVSVPIEIIPEPAKTYYVDATEGSDDNDGLSLQTAFATIQKAIDSAFDGDTIIVADGIYTGPGNRDIDFLGKAITVRSESGSENCIIDCNAGRWEQHRGFYFHNGEQENSVVDGFTITNAYHYYDGGAISCIESSPTIGNCIITGNSADLGGGIYFRQSHPTITNCSITENQGGGIFCMDSSPVIVNCTIAENQIVGIYCRWYSSPVITNCNIAENKGSGIVVDDSSLTVANCTITGNSIEHPGGGGISSYNSELTIDNSTITGNSAAWGGGLYVFRAHRNLIITNCTISGNTAKGIEGEYAYGGGIICIQSWDMDEDEPFTFSNCTISGNTAEMGGGIYCDDSILTVANCILWDDSATHGPEITIMNYKGWHSSLSIAYSDVQDGQDDIHVEPDCTLNWGLGNIDADPYFVEQGYRVDGNDPNIIVEPNDPNAVWVEGDYHLLLDSPCIDSGDPNYIPEPNEKDLDGNPRVFGDRIDMGAYEFIPNIDATIDIQPETLNLASRGKWINCRIGLGEDYNIGDIDPNSVLLEGEIKAESLRLNEQKQAAIARFNRSDVRDMLVELGWSGDVELTVTGYLMDGSYFVGTDTIKVIDKGSGKPAK